MRLVALPLVLLALIAGLHLAVAQGVTEVPPALAAVLFWQSEAPRVLMAVAVGAGLGMAGAAMQEVTRNPLVAPTTLGTVAGSWLALLVATLLAPVLAAKFGPWIALAGGGAATATVLAIAGPLRMHGIVVVVLGMAVNLFLGGVVVVITLLNGEAVRAMFIWGAGDLTQTGWDALVWTAPQLAIAAVALLLLARPLTVMRLGSTVASGRGVPTTAISVAALGLAVWLTAASVAAVGAIAFIGLLSPNIVRSFGVRSTARRLVLSGVMGALALTACDILPVALSHWSRDLIPTGAAAALIGAPAMVLLAMRRGRGGDRGSISAVAGRSRPAAWFWPILVCLGLLAAVAAIGVGGTADGPVWLSGGTARQDAMILSLRWPSVVAAVGAGIAMATTGVVLQRLLGNPLASPDVLGVTSGATLAVVCAVVFFGLSLARAAVPAAAIGALLALGLLSLVWRRRATPPALLVLTGLALAALLDALVQFALARGGDEAQSLLVWLTGATFLTGGRDALLLLAVALAFLLACLRVHRWLTLLTLGDPVAEARGLSVERARRTLLTLAAAATAAVVAWVGPITFIGLLAPHAAILLGARRTVEQLLAAAVIGAGLMAAAELTGRLASWPNQIPVGAVASVVGGLYLMGLTLSLLVRRRGAPW